MLCNLLTIERKSEVILVRGVGNQENEHLIKWTQVECFHFLFPPNASLEFLSNTFDGILEIHKNFILFY